MSAADAANRGGHFRVPAKMETPAVALEQMHEPRRAE